MLKITLAASVLVALTGCTVATKETTQNNIISKNQFQRLSTVLERIRNVNPDERYSLSTPDISFDFHKVDAIKTYEDLAAFLEKEGFVVEVVANKYRKDLPKIIAVSEKGKYAGNLSTALFSPYPNKKLNDVLLDLGSSIKFSIEMDQDSIAFSSAFPPPSGAFNGRTVADFLSFIEGAYDLHVEINTRAATIKVMRYKSRVFSILAEKDRLKKDISLFLANDIENRNAKNFAAENGKVFISGTPSVIKKVERYAQEINADSSKKSIVSFDGKMSVGALMGMIAKQDGADVKIGEGDFLPALDAGVWFDKISDVDKYLRTQYNKKIIKTSSIDINRDGVDDLFTYNIKDVVGVRLDTPTTVSSFFKKLSLVDKNDYIVDGDANIPVSRMEIDEFSTLRDYLYSSGGIIIEMTDPGDGFPKIIKVK